MSDRVSRAARAAVLAAALAVGLAACSHPAAPQPLPVRPSIQPATLPAVSVPAATPAGGTSASGPSEAGHLAAFFAASARLDNRLARAAALVNGGIGVTGITLRPETVAALRALDTTPVSRAIPPGLPRHLLRSVLLVYSDLVSRSVSLSRLASYPGTVSKSSQAGRTMLRCLAKGAPAAARYDGDMAVTRTLAQASPPLASPAPESRAAGGLAVRITAITRQNTCSAQCGGEVFPALPPITWHRRQETSPGAGTYWNGTLGGLRFLATYRAGHGWNVVIYAC
jgi:hypothetical protein